MELEKIAVAETWQGDMEHRTAKLEAVTTRGAVPVVSFFRESNKVTPSGVLIENDWTGIVSRKIDAARLSDPTEVVTVAGNTIPLALVFGAVQAFGDKWHREDRSAQ